MVTKETIGLGVTRYHYRFDKYDLPDEFVEELCRKYIEAIDELEDELDVCYTQYEWDNLKEEHEDEVSELQHRIVELEKEIREMKLEE